MPRSSWTVVKFNNENSVEAVPTSWINNNRCFWPSFQHDKVVAAIRKNEEPDIHWPSYGITIFRNSTCDNYITAREKCKKAESTSDLNSEMSGEEKKKRRIRKRQFSSSEDDESSYNFLSTPLLKDNYRQEARENTIDQEVAVTQDARNNTFTKASCSGESFQHSSSLKKPDRMKATGKQVAAQQDNYFEDNFVNSEKKNFPFTNSKCTCPAHVQMQNKNEVYFKEIIRQQNYFKAQLWQTSEDIREIKNIGLNQANGINNSIQRRESIFRSFTLPLETEEELQKVEQFLRNQANFETSVTEASRTGGKHCYEFVKRNLNQLLSNKLAQTYSWFGKKQKKKFYELKLAEMLIAAGETYNDSFSRKDIEESAQKWLRRAKERFDASETKLANRIRNE